VCSTNTRAASATKQVLQDHSVRHIRHLKLVQTQHTTARGHKLLCNCRQRITQHSCTSHTYTPQYTQNVLRLICALPNNKKCHHTPFLRIWWS
jgi:hypothetical protein